MSDPRTPDRKRITFAEAAWFAPLSITLLLASALRAIPIDFTEACGFVSGALCVWLVTKQNIWNWPVGLVNNLFFGWLFWRAGLFADMGLQGVYLGLGVWGWWHWSRGGGKNAELPVSRATLREWIAVAVFVVAGTWALRLVLIAVGGSAPFWDAFTSILCLAAQYWLCMKRIENWWLWILADVVYVPLYLARGLPLTALLYAGFIVLCSIGLARWRKQAKRQTAEVPA